MRVLSATVLMVTAISIAVIFAAPLSSASDGTVNIKYDPTQDIDVTVPKTIPVGGTLTIDAYSDRYDLGVAGMMLYTFGPDGKPDYTTSGRPPSAPRTLLEDGSYRFVFYNVTEDVEVSFTEPLPLREQNSTGTPDPDEKQGGIETDGTTATVILLASVIAGAVMLVFMTLILRMLDRPSKKQKVAL